MRSFVPALVVTLPWFLACGSSRSSDGNDAGRGGAPSAGSSGSQMVNAGAGQGATGGASRGGSGGTAGNAAGRGGAPAAGQGSGGTAGRGQAGETTGGGGAGGAPGGMAGEGGADDNGGTGGSGGGSAGCRLYASEFTVTSSGTFVTVSCAFDRASLSMTCTTDDGDVTVTTWATLADAVAEYRPIGLRRAVRTDEMLALGTAPCHLTRDNRYDGSGRLIAMDVTIDPEMSCGTNQATYDMWDSDGRQTHGVESGVGGETCVGGDVSFIYDDAERTITTTRSGGTDCLAFSTVLNHDTDGLRTTAVNGTSGVVSSTYQTVATDEICE